MQCIDVKAFFWIISSSNYIVTNEQCRVSGTCNSGSLMKCFVDPMPFDALSSVEMSSACLYSPKSA